MNQRFAALVPLAALVLAGCSTSTSARSATAQQPPTSPAVAPSSSASGASGASSATSATPAQSFAEGDCDHAPYSNSAPDFATRNAPKGVPFVVSVHGDAVGYLFADPLRAGAGHSEHANKILWYVRQPRDAHPLEIQARPRGAGGPVVGTSIAADAGPGEIYPSTVDVPTAGCWRFHLTWGAHQDDIDLRYVP